MAGGAAIDFLAVRFVLTAGGCISWCFGALSNFLLSLDFKGDLEDCVVGFPLTISPKTPLSDSWFGYEVNFQLWTEYTKGIIH